MTQGQMIGRNGVSLTEGNRRRIVANIGLKREHRRWTFVIFVLFLFTVIGLLLSVMFSSDPFLSSLFLGITGSIICSGLVLFFSEILFSNIESKNLNSELLQSIKAIDLNLKESRKTIYSTAGANQVFHVAEIFSHASKISLLGYDLSEIFENHSEEMVKILNRGGEINVVLVSYSGTTKTIIDEHTNAREKFEKGYLYAKRKLDDLQKMQKSGRLNYYETSWPTSFKAVICEGDSWGISRIDFIPFSLKQPYENHRVLILDRQNDSDHYNYFRSSFEYIVTEDSKKIF